MVDGTVAFHDAVVWKACFLELPVDIAGEDEVPMGFICCQALQDMEPFMGNHLAVTVQPMTIEAPCQPWIVGKGIWIRNLNERNAVLSQFRIGFPKSLVATEVRQSRIDTHASTGGNQDAVSFPDDVSGMDDFTVKGFCHGFLLDWAAKERCNHAEKSHTALC